MNGKIFIAALASSLLAVNGGIFAEEKSGQKILVAYFSHSGENYGVGVVEKGNTEKLAEIIAEKTGGELFKIETEKNYSRKYRECIDEAKKELSQNARPELKKIADVSGYDTIFLGYPIWWGDLPMAVYTFLESADFSGKKIIPFCTHEGSGLSATDRKIESKCRNSSVGEALSLRGTTAQNDRAKSQREVEAWLKKNRLKNFAERISAKKIAEKIQRTNFAEKFHGRISVEKFCGKNSAKKIAEKIQRTNFAEKFHGRISVEKFCGKNSAKKNCGKNSAEEFSE